MSSARSASLAPTNSSKRPTSSSQPAAVFGEEVTQDRPTRRLISIHAHENDTPVIGRNLGLQHGGADVAGGAVPAKLLEDLFLAGVVVTDGEGHQDVQREFLGAIGGHQGR
jgi:hypothetical protein